jgi:muconate cycloisomerase
MKIDQVRIYYGFHKNALSTSRGMIKRCHVAAIELVSNGLSGWGETMLADPNDLELEGKAKGRLEELCAQFVGREVSGPADGLPDMNSLDGDDVLFRGYREGVSIALYDLYGRALGVNVATLLGGVQRRVFPFMPVIHVNPPETMARRSRKWVDDGVQFLKIKYRGEREIDTEALRAIREAVGPEIRLQIDANAGYKDVDEAVAVIRDLEPYDVEIVEDFFAGDLEDFIRVRSAIKPMFMLDGPGYFPNVQRLVAAEAVDIVNMHPRNVGGLDVAMKIAAVAESAGIPTSIGSCHLLGVGTAAYQLLAAVIATTRPCEEIGLAPYFYGPIADEFEVYDDPEIVVEPFPVENGQITIRETPGLGVEVDRAKLENVATSMFES